MCWAEARRKVRLIRVSEAKGWRRDRIWPRAGVGVLGSSRYRSRLSENHPEQRLPIRPLPHRSPSA